jgi:hypothetical protein
MWNLAALHVSRQISICFGLDETGRRIIETQSQTSRGADPFVPPA